jgi:hypothetical protein
MTCIIRQEEVDNEPVADGPSENEVNSLLMQNK